MEIRLRGQPARTDVSLDLPRRERCGWRERSALPRNCDKMPVRTSTWNGARRSLATCALVAGSDPGWRGDLTGELHLDGTADAAQVKTRLRARVFTGPSCPAAPMDFDASCGLLFHYSQRAFENLECNSPLGDGRIRVAGDLPGSGVLPHFSVELDRFPSQPDWMRCAQCAAILLPDCRLSGQ